MRNTIKSGIVIKIMILTALLSSCKTQEKLPYVVIDIAGTINTKGPDTLTLNDIFNIERVITTETSDNIVLSHMTIATASGDHIVVYESDALYFLNKEDGKMLSKLRKRGNGPGEYIRILDATLNNQDSTIYLLDPDKRKLNLYTFNGNFIKSVENDSIGIFRILNDGNFVVAYAPYPNSEYGLGIYDKSWNFIRKSIPRDNTHEYQMHYFEGIDKFNGEYYYRAAHQDTIYHITSESEKPYIVISKGNYKLPAEIEASLSSLNKEGYKYVQQDYGMLVSKYFFLQYYFDMKLYRDIWDIETESLLYRGIIGEGGGILGIPLSINGIQINVWPRYVSGDFMYCVVEAQDAVKFIPSLPEDANPVIVELKLKEK